MESTYDTLLQYALRLIAKKRYTETEICRKLENKKIGGEKQINKVVSRLKELNYINDKEFTKDYISSRMLLNPRGKRMLFLELKLKGINPEIIKEVLEKANIDEIKAAGSIIERKKRSLNKLTKQKKREKILTWLASRGFEMETIYKILKNW